MINQIITIVPIGEVSSFILKHIKKTLEQKFNFTINILPWEKISRDVPVPVHGDRYNSTRILKYIADRVPENTLKLLAITELDLYSPIFSCLFGEAQLKGSCALVSLFRLRQEFYNLSPDRDLFLSRVEKEVIHEIAHTFGLLHCCDKNCIMYPSNNIIDTDSKSSSFCPKCIRLLGI